MRLTRMQIRSGASRHVLLICEWAIKIPRLTSWRSFLWGLLANDQERMFSRFKGMSGLCPIVAACPLGFWVVMRRARPLSQSEFAEFDYDEFVRQSQTFDLVEFKRCSFGWVGNEIVAVDYG